MVENLSRIHLHDSGNFYVSSNNAIWKSTDNGLTWTSMSMPPKGDGIVFYGNYEMESATTRFVHSSNGISKTEDAGATWKYIFKTENPFHFINHFYLKKM